jgi:hypothetical protein
MKEFKKPDLKAPRYRPEVYSVLDKTFFDNFRKKHSKYKDYTNEDLRNIIKSFNKLVFNTVIEKRDGVQLPETIGWLFIGTCQRSKKTNVDYAKSHKYGVTVTNKNFDTDGKLAKIFFTSHAPKHKMKNKEFWSFVACREFKRAVSKNYPENWNMYVVVDAATKLREIYQKAVYKNIVAEKEKEALKTYNEFDL